MGDFFWLLASQRAAPLVWKESRQQGAADTAHFCAHVVGQDDEQPAEAEAAAVVLEALASSAADVPAFLQRRGLGGDALQAACSEALMAVLAPPAASPAADGAAAAAATVGLPAVAQAAAAVLGTTGLAGRLLALGANPSYARPTDGLSLLAAAIRGGHFEAACALLDAGAQPDGSTAPVPAATAAPAATPGTPAAAAAASAVAVGLAGSSGDRAAKRQRQEAAGASQQQQQQPGVTGEQPATQPTPLVLAVAADHATLVERLLAAGADVNRQCSMQPPGAAAPVPLTPLIAAVNSGSASLVSRLVSAGADLHHKCFASPGGGVDWTSALSAAVLASPPGDTALVRLLVDAGACAGRNGARQVGRDHPALRAVVLAAQRGRADLLDLLYPPVAAALQGGPAALVATLRRRTALHPLAAAAERGHLAAVERLLALGAPPNHDASVSAGVLQTTPLMLAAGNGHLAVVERLLAAGASPLKANSRGEVAAALALRRGQLAVVRRLLEHGGELAAGDANNAAAAGGPASPAAAAGAAAAGLAPRAQLASASKAWQQGFQSGAASRHRPLSLAALEEERQRYQLLLLALLEASAGGGAAAAAMVRQLATPAALAHAAAGSEALLDALLACGVSLDAADPSGGPSSLAVAAHCGWPAMLRLLQRGADPNQADSGGGTLLMALASRPGLLDAALELLSWHAARQEEAEAEEEGEEGGEGQQAPSGARQQQQQQQAANGAQPPPPHQQQAANGAQQAAQPQQTTQQQQAAQQARQRRPPLLDPLRLSLEGRDALGVALAAKNRRFGEALLEHLARQQQRQQLRWQRRRLQGTQSAGAGQLVPLAPAGEVQAAAGVAARAYELLADNGAMRLADINKPGPDGRHLLLAQVPGATRKQLRTLLALPGLDLGARDAATGCTALHLAVQRGQPAILCDLLGWAGRLDLEARDAQGATAALLAARSGSGDGSLLRDLVAAGAGEGDPTAADASGDTPLMALARRGQHKLLLELLRSPAAAAALDRRDANGLTALHHAAAAGSFNACKVLRGFGADPTLRTWEEPGRTAAELAAAGGHNACLPLLKATAAEQAA